MSFTTATDRRATQVYALHLPPRLPAAVYERLLAFVAPEKRERIGRFFRWTDAYLCLFADLLVRHELSRVTGCPPGSFAFVVYTHGKPVVVNVPGFHFNTSHSGSWVVCAVADSEVGVDVEQVGEADVSVSEHFFSKEEHADIISSADPGLRFFDYWTLKESYIKYIGRGLSEPLDSFGIRFHDWGGIGLVGHTKRNVHLRQYPLEDGYRLAVCAGHDYFATSVITYTAADLISALLDE